MQPTCQRFSDEHGFAKPNDERALKLMDHAAQAVMAEYKDIVLAFGESDEYRYAHITPTALHFLDIYYNSFLLRKTTSLYNRRHAKIVSTLTHHSSPPVTYSTGPHISQTRLWNTLLLFDGRIILYPSGRETRDYFSWRQADSTCFRLP